MLEIVEVEDEVERILRVVSETEGRSLPNNTEDEIKVDSMYEFIKRDATVGSLKTLEIEPLPKGAELEKVYNSIDPMLKDAMCLLWSYNIITRYSCQGHMENEDGYEEGYIYMDFNMLAFNALSRAMFQADNTLKAKCKAEFKEDRTLIYPYMQLERCVRKVNDSYSRDELIVRFKFHPLNVISREEFYSIFTRILAIALDEESNLIVQNTFNTISTILAQK